MASFMSRVVDRGFRLMMMRDLDTPEKFVSHGRFLLNLVRPPAFLPDGVSIRKTTVANEPAVPPGVPAMCVSTASPSCTVLYVHGGAFIGGKFPTYAGICGQLAKRLNARVYWIDYRLAPEMPFPAASDDAFHAYCALARDFPGDPLAIIGDSAGGNLTLSTLLRVRDTLAGGQHDPGLRMPQCAIAMSAATDLASASPSRQANDKSDCALSARIIDYAAGLYLAGHDACDPYASPLFGELHDLPPLLLSVSEAEVVRDDTYRFANRARKAGVPVQILSRWDAPHAWIVLNALMPEARRDLGEIIRFMQQHLRAPASSHRTVTPLRQALAS